MSARLELKLLALLKDYRDALDQGNEGVVRYLGDQFNDTVDDLDSIDRVEELRAIFDAINNAQAEEIFEAFGESAKRFGKLKDAFQLGKAMVEGGQEDLFFPSAAAELSTLLGSLKALKKAAVALTDNVDNLEQTYGASDVEALIKELELSKEEIEQVIDAFLALKDSL